MVPVQSLFEAHLTVADLTRSMKFYGETLGMELAAVLEQPKVAFYWMGGRGKSMLGLWEVGNSPQRMSLHIAFSVELEEPIDRTRETSQRRYHPARCCAKSHRRTRSVWLDAGGFGILSRSR